MIALGVEHDTATSTVIANNRILQGFIYFQIFLLVAYGVARGAIRKPWGSYQIVMRSEASEYIHFALTDFSLRSK